MKVPTLYLDTSVIGGYFDDEWKDPTRELWRQLEAGQYRFLTSEVTIDELTAAPERVREIFARTFPSEAIVGVTAEIESLLHHGSRAGGGGYAFHPARLDAARAAGNVAGTITERSGPGAVGRSGPAGTGQSGRAVTGSSGRAASERSDAAAGA